MATFEGFGALLLSAKIALLAMMGGATLSNWLCKHDNHCFCIWPPFFSCSSVLTALNK